MSYKLFIDDERCPTTPDWMIARTSYDAIWMVENYGMPTEIAFDHDLGGEDTTMVFLKWLEQKLMEEFVAFPTNFKYSIHSQNPIGAKNIKLYMEDLLNFF